LTKNNKQLRLGSSGAKEAAAAAHVFVHEEKMLKKSPEGIQRKHLELSEQGCQRVFFQTKIPNLGKFWRALD
jgi:hypothetical protein